MQVFFLQLSVLVGLLVFLNQLWRQTPLEQTIFQGFTTGLVIYLVLLVGTIAVRRVLAYQPPQADAEDAEGTTTPEPAPEESTPVAA